MRVHTNTTDQNTPQTVYTYNLDSESLVSAIKVLWLEGAYPYSNANFALPNSYKVQYNNGTTWVDVPNLVATSQEFSRYNLISFSPVKTKALRITTVPPAGKNCRPFDIEVTADAVSGFFFRSARDGSNTHLFYNNELLTTIVADFRAAQVGFGSTIKDCKFDGIMCYQNNEITDGEISVLAATATPKETNFTAYVVDKNLVVDTTDNNLYNIELFDSLGKLVWQGDNFVGRSISNISHLNKSVYIAKIQNNFSHSYVRKVILN
jgi:hypothetical protein